LADLSKFTLFFDGGLATEGRLDLYDASQSYYGFARVLAILGHYYGHGKIIAQAPFADVELYLGAAEEGTFRQTVYAGTIGAVLSAPFVSFVDYTVKSWLPSPDSDTKKIVQLLEEQNRILRGRQATASDKSDEQVVKKFNQEHQTEIDVLRSVTANSFRKIFRPVGRSADVGGILAGASDAPIGLLDADGVALMETDFPDSITETVVGVVNSFSRSSKTGIAFSDQIKRGFRFEYVGEAELKRGDIFSWSQYTGREIKMTGRFVRFFDKTIKRFDVFSAEIEPDEE
jgi:hypothetical protein